MLAAVAAWGEEPSRSTDRPAKGPPTGSLVIIGGAARHDNEDIWNEVVRRAGGAKGRIAVFPCASSYPQKNGERTVQLLKRHGGDAFLVPLAISGIDGVDYHELSRDAEWLERVRSSQGVFFIGGSQGRICDALLDESGRNSPMLDAVWDVYRRGGVVAGTSAGAAVMSRVMFRDSGVLSALMTGVQMGREIDRGLGFLDPGWFVDQHCLVRGRFARTLVAMHDQRIQHGIGVDEDTAVVVEGGETARIVGHRGAIVLDLSRARSDAEQDDFNVRAARLTYVNHGDAIDLETLAVTPAATKGPERPVTPSTVPAGDAPVRPLLVPDILGNTTLIDVMRRVIARSDRQATGLAFDTAAALVGPTPGFEFRFYCGPDTASWESEAQGVSELTIQNVYLDVRPVKVNGPLYQAEDDSEGIRPRKDNSAANKDGSP